MNRKSSPKNPEQGVWLWGIHAVKAALCNPARACHQLLYTQEMEPQIQNWNFDRPALSHQQVDKRVLDTKFPQGVHQGVALRVSLLASLHLETFCQQAAADTILVLDHVTDPQNVGALFRVGAALSVGAVMMTQKHAPPFHGALAKSASGALEHVPLITVANLAQGLDTLKKNDFWCVGLAEEGTQPLHKMALGNKIALVLGAEGEGLRRLTRERCDVLAHLPTASTFQTLNVSTAGAIALYELKSRHFE